MSQTPIYDELMREFNARRRIFQQGPLIDRPSKSVQGVRPVTAILDETTLVERFVVQLDKQKPSVRKTADVKTLAGVSVGRPTQE